MKNQSFKRFFNDPRQKPPHKSQWVPRKKALPMLYTIDKRGSLLVWDSQILGTYFRKDNGPLKELKIPNSIMKDRSRMLQMQRQYKPKKR